MHAARRHAPYFARVERERGGDRRRVPGHWVSRRFVVERLEHHASERRRVAAVLPFGGALSGFVQWV